MKKPHIHSLFCATTLSLAAVFALPAHAQSASPDSGLYTTYFFSGSTFFRYQTCGAIGSSVGCYGSGQVTPFTHLCALMEGNESVNTKTNTVTRDIYVLDAGHGAGRALWLYVYSKSDAILGTSDTVTVKKIKTIGLPTRADANAECFMAADDGYIYIGTNESSAVARVTKSDNSLETLFSAGQSSDVSSITSNRYGFVDINFGVPGTTGYGDDEFRPDGSQAGSGSSGVLLNTAVATPVPADAPAAGSPPSAAPPVLWPARRSSH